MSDTKWTPGDWEAVTYNDGSFDIVVRSPDETNGTILCGRNPCGYMANESRANGKLFAASPRMYREMERYLPVIERLEADPQKWTELTAGLGIATGNGYRYAMALARGETDNSTKEQDQ